MDPIRGSGNRRHGRAVPRGPAEHVAQIRRRQACERERVRLRNESYIARHGASAAFINAHRQDGERAESSAAEARRAPPALAQAVPANLIDYLSSDVDDEVVGPVEVEVAPPEAVVSKSVVQDISDDDMAGAGGRCAGGAAEPAAGAEPDGQVMARVLARSVRTTLRKHVRRHHIAAYNAEQLEAGLWASEYFEANRQFWCVDALLQAYMADSSEEE